MMHQPFYDPNKTYEENFSDGPFGAFADGEVLTVDGEPRETFLGVRVRSRFGIPAGPLINGRFIAAALDKGFDIVTYKTVRTSQYPCHAWPNVVAVDIAGDLHTEQAERGVTVMACYREPLSITNSFGVPSWDPDIWQADMAAAAARAGGGQVVIGSFQGTPRGHSQEYIQDFVLAARLVKATGVKILEVNLSCPNEGGGQLLCFDAPRVQEVVTAIKNEIGNTPLIIKIAYFKDDVQLSQLLNAVGGVADGIEAINTIGARITDARGKQYLPGAGRERSGVCGAGIKWAGLSMVKRLAFLKEKLNLRYTVIGVGGIMNAGDYRAYISAGADAALSATGAMWNPYLAQEIKKAEVRSKK